MLAKCPEGGGGVSTTADKCPNCGAPIVEPSESLIPKQPKKVQGIEKTSKPCKAQKLLSLALFFVGTSLTDTGRGHRDYTPFVKAIEGRREGAW